MEPIVLNVCSAVLQLSYEVASTFRKCGPGPGALLQGPLAEPGASPFLAGASAAVVGGRSTVGLSTG